MKRKLLLLTFLFLVGGWPAFAQLSINGTISSSGTTCATASACVVLNLQPNQGSASITVGGTFSGTLQFEVAGDSQTYVSVNAYPPNSTTAATSTTSTGTWTVSTAGMTNLRVRASALASGSASVTLQSSAAMTAVNLPGGTGGSGTVTSVATTGPITGGTFTTSGTIACGTCVVATSPGVGLAHFAGSTQTATSSTVATADIAANAVTSAKEAVVNTYRYCDIPVGDESGSAITNGQLGPQVHVCKVPMAATVVEVDVDADAGSPSVIVGRRRCTTFTTGVCSAETVVNLLSGALAVASGFEKCSNTGGTTGLDGGTTCASTLQNTGLNAGDWIELVSGTAGGTAKFFVAHIIYTVN